MMYMCFSCVNFAGFPLVERRLATEIVQDDRPSLLHGRNRRHNISLGTLSPLTLVEHCVLCV